MGTPLFKNLFVRRVEAVATAMFSTWEIRNFSCWNHDIHGESLQTNRVKLYPRGVLGGNCEHIVVSIESGYFGGGELSFIGSDGSVICTREPYDHSAGNRNFTGPKFEEVVAGIRGNEPLHKDRLILRWKIDNRYCQRQGRTVIHACTAFFQLTPELVLDVENSDWKPISEIYFDFKGKQKMIAMSLRKTGSTEEEMKVKFKFESETGVTILARTSIWMLSNDKVVQTHEDNSLFDKGDYHILPYEIHLKELQESQTQMRCKIITGKISEEVLNSSMHSKLSPLLGITLFSGCSKIKCLENTSESVVSDEIEESNSILTLRELTPENSVAALAKDFMCLYQDHNFSDFELRCGDVSFPTHRGILSVRSPVLKAMLSGDMREAASGHMDVEDLDPHTLGRFLAFLYSGTCQDLEWEGALKLYYAADKYQVPYLKEECIAVLHASVSLENVCDILSLADKHNDEKLRSFTYNYILENYNEVLGSKKWEEFMLSESLLAVKTVTHFAKNNSVKKSVTN